MTKEEFKKLQNEPLIMWLTPFIGKDEVDKIISKLEKEVESEPIEDEVVNGLMSKNELQKLVNDLRCVEEEIFKVMNEHGIDLSRMNVYILLSNVILDLLTYMFGEQAAAEIFRVVYAEKTTTLDELYNIINKSE